MVLMIERDLKALRLLSLLTAITLFIACGPEPVREHIHNSKTGKSADNPKELPTDTPDYFIIGDSLWTNPGRIKPELNYKFNFDTSAYLLESIVIYDGEKEIQRIFADKDCAESGFKLIDCNFDGYRDISVLAACGSGGCTYWIWNYDPRSHSFQYNKELSGIIGLEIDTANRHVVFHYRAGYPEENWDTFVYEANRLTFLRGVYRERWSDENGKPWVKLTRTVMENGKPVVTIDSSNRQDEQFPP